MIGARFYDLPRYGGELLEFIRRSLNIYNKKKILSNLIMDTDLHEWVDKVIEIYPVLAEEEQDLKRDFPRKEEIDAMVQLFFHLEKQALNRFPYSRNGLDVVIPLEDSSFQRIYTKYKSEFDIEDNPLFPNIMKEHPGKKTHNEGPYVPTIWGLRLVEYLFLKGEIIHALHFVVFLGKYIKDNGWGW